MTDHKIADFKPKKTAARMKIIKGIVESITSDDVYEAIKKEKWKEAKFATYLYQFLRAGVEKIFLDLYPSQTEKNIANKVNNAVYWDGAKNNTISAIPLFGTKHWPDFAVNIGGINIAVELKRGMGGESLRSGIGQCLVYSMDYDFVIYLLIDVSQERKIKNNSTGERESYLIKSLWDKYNIKLVIV